jgi:hypothetical protein
MSKKVFGSKKLLWIFSSITLGLIGLWLSGVGVNLIFWRKAPSKQAGFIKPDPLKPSRLEGFEEESSPAAEKVQSELSLAVEKGDLVAARKALENGADPDRHAQNSAFPLYIALWKKNAGAVKVLLDAGADPNIASHPLQGTPLLTAVDRGDRESVILLLKAGADPCYKVEHDTAASWARKKGYKEITLILWAASPCLIP